MGMAFSIFVVMHKGFRLVRNHILDLPTWSWSLVYIIRAPGAGDKSAPNSTLDRIYTLLHTDCPRISRLSHCARCLSNKADNPMDHEDSSVTWLFRDPLLRWGRLGGALHLRKPISHQYKGAQDSAQH
jgi:hypothetical protein